MGRFRVFFLLIFLSVLGLEALKTQTRFKPLKTKPYVPQANDPTTPGHPVVLVPGDGGSQIEANLTGKPSVVHYTCYSKTADFFDLWLDLTSFVPVTIDCWVDNMRLVFNTTTGMSEDSPGVETRIQGFGGTASVEWLDKSKASQGTYFTYIADALTKWGYTRGKDLRGAPFDWRRAPHELTGYYAMLRTLIETTYYYNNNTKVIILGHSMGNPSMLEVNRSRMRISDQKDDVSLGRF
ncbi:hypothetical protein L596_008432 [Steinernema carpocapsae]|uniref:Uncharacterized protein n=1 Tax=Steinernema carpocapsae TaxID=34508 RepID=A0A4U5PCR4_STECR|nr:hypothetical protein L596_008432 [Steinernema carpocapsae]